MASKHDTHRREKLQVDLDKIFHKNSLSQVIENLTELYEATDNDDADGRFDVTSYSWTVQSYIEYYYWVPLTEEEIEKRNARLAKDREERAKRSEAAKKGQKTKVERQVREALDILAKHQDVLTEIMDK
jgi:hypothetical protein